jgi:hypothetical protein
MLQNTITRSTDFSRLGLLHGIHRLPTDTNQSLKNKITNLWRFKENSTKQGMVNSISNVLGYEQYNTITRRIFYLSQIPKPTTTITVTVDGAACTEITETQYPTATSGYIVWKDSYSKYTNLLEFVDPPDYNRTNVARLHAGTYIKVTYEYEKLDANTNTLVTYWMRDECNPYDPDDESYMGASPDTEGSIGVYPINNKSWLEDSTNLLKNVDGTPTQKLWAIMTVVDRTVPTTWGA